MIRDDVRIDGDGRFTVNAAGVNRVLLVDTAGAAGRTDVTLAGLTLTGGAARADRGGGVQVTAGEAVTLSGVVVTGNTADFGGGVYNAGTLVINGSSSVTGNRASDGGGIYNDGGALQVLGSAVTANAAFGTLGRGGGVYSAGGGVTVFATTVSGNRAHFTGGGVEVFGGRFVLDQSLLGGNMAGTGQDFAGNAGVRGDGGGLHVGGTDAAVTVHRSDVRGNTATRGAGLWNRTGNALTVERSYVRMNSAEGTDDEDGGGGIFNDGGDLLVVASVVANNAAVGTTGPLTEPVPVSGRGGGIYSAGGEVVVYVSTVGENSAARAGGGAHVAGGRFVADRSVLAANGVGSDAAPGLGYGGGLSASGVGTFVYLYHSEVRDNRATLAGGGLWNLAGGTLIVDRSTVAGNVARGAEGGGGIFNAGDVAVVLSYVRDNRAGGPSVPCPGGGVYQAGGGTARVERSVVTRNEAGGTGGGVYTETGAVTNVDALESVFANLPDDFAGPGAIV